MGVRLRAERFTVTLLCFITKHLYLNTHYNNNNTCTIGSKILILDIDRYYVSCIRDCMKRS